MLVIFLRHGVAEEQGHDVPGADEKRRLVKQGVKETKQVADALRALKVIPTTAFTSPLVRAVETADAALSRFKKPPAAHTMKALSPDGSWQQIKKGIASRVSADDTVLLVGHQPSFGEHVMRALGADPKEEFGFPKSGCVVLEWKDNNLDQPADLVLALSPPLARRIRKLTK